MTDKAKVFQVIIEEVKTILKNDITINNKLKEICILLENKVPYYNWVGFYLIDPSEDGWLDLYEYVGAETEHTRIKFGQGICGQAADKKETFVVQDVSQEDNYLSCSLETKSEIVVPMMKNDILLGELDIDSHTINPFSEEDSVYLKQICDLVVDELY
jgi:L-methionine (R)-S-oxide reductase